MEQPLDDVNPRKRGLSETLETSWDEESAKRPCLESSCDLKLLEDLYDLEAEDDDAQAETPHESCNKEDLVAEMMKSLEKALEDGEEVRGEGEPSTSGPGPIPSPFVCDLDLEWGTEEIPQFSGSPLREAGSNGEAPAEEGFQKNAEITELLQVSDDDLGVTSSSSVSDPDDTSFYEEWALLASEGAMAGNSGLFEASLQPFEEPSLSKEMFEPLLLF